MGGNYEKGIYNQLMEQIEINKKLVGENKGLRAEITALKAENKRLYERITKLEASADEKIALYVIEAVKQATEPLIIELNKAHTEIARLKAIINKDSSNSSKPPSSNGLKVIPNSREQSKRPQGGQKGHKGHRLALPENMDKLEKQGIVERRVVDHTGGEGSYVSKYTIDLEMKVIVTEHRFIEGEVPEDFNNEVSYGNNIKAQAVLLMNEGIVAHKRLSGIFSGLTHNIVNLSTGTMNKFQSDFADQLIETGELSKIEKDLLNGYIMNTDDTPMKVLERPIYSENEEESNEVTYERAKNKSLSSTVRTHSNEQSTLYTVNPKKDIKGIERDGILPKYMGILCHDHEAKFFNYGVENAACGTHLARDLKGLSDSYNCQWALEVRRFVLDMNDHKNNDVAVGIGSCDPAKLSEFEAMYDQHLVKGWDKLGQMEAGTWGQKEFNAMLKRLTASKDNYMLFVRDYKVPFTNNLAERDLRSGKTKEKVSGLFRSWKGIEDYTKIGSFISTLKKRGKDLFRSIKKVMESEPVLT